jgi:acyl-CoA synthetase (AMP-forming)/AMP-acid ligase II
MLLDCIPKYLDRVFIDAPTQHGAHGDRQSITYGEALRQAFNLAAWLRMRGIGLEDRVGLIAFNCIE